MKADDSEDSGDEEGITLLFMYNSSNSWWKSPSQAN